MELKVLRFSLGVTMIDSIRNEYISRKAQQVGKGEMVLTCDIFDLPTTLHWISVKENGWMEAWMKSEKLSKMLSKAEPHPPQLMITSC